ncbi:hypothetical protein HK405_004499 [Cladochytrium tenue]|nr:hypothetical protein HK405_004499 [Cladochytrium tenue]
MRQDLGGVAPETAEARDTAAAAGAPAIPETSMVVSTYRGTDEHADSKTFEAPHSEIRVSQKDFASVRSDYSSPASKLNDGSLRSGRCDSRSLTPSINLQETPISRGLSSINIEQAPSYQSASQTPQAFNIEQASALQPPPILKNKVNQTPIQRATQIIEDILSDDPAFATNAPEFVRELRIKDTSTTTESDGEDLRHKKGKQPLVNWIESAVNWAKSVKGKAALEDWNIGESASDAPQGDEFSDKLNNVLKCIDNIVEIVDDFTELHILAKAAWTLAVYGYKMPEKGTILIIPAPKGRCNLTELTSEIRKKKEISGPILITVYDDTSNEEKPLEDNEDEINNCLQDAVTFKVQSMYLHSRHHN